MTNYREVKGIGRRLTFRVSRRGHDRSHKVVVLVLVENGTISKGRRDDSRHISRKN